MEYLTAEDLRRASKLLEKKWYQLIEDKKNEFVEIRPGSQPGKYDIAFFTYNPKTKTKKYHK